MIKYVDKAGRFVSRDEAIHDAMVKVGYAARIPVPAGLSLRDILTDREIGLIGIKYLTHDPLSASDLETIETASQKVADAGYTSNGPKDRLP